MSSARHLGPERNTQGTQDASAKSPAVRELGTLEEYWAWLEAMDRAKWREVTTGERQPPQFVTIPNELRSHPRFYEHMSGDWTAALDVATGAYELVRKVLPSYTVLDVGAHIGHFTKAVAPRCQYVMAIEALARNAQKIRDLRLPNVGVLNLAASDTSSQLVTFHASQSSSEGSVKPISEWLYTTQVMSIAIDDLGLQELDFVKIDVEGSEAAVIRGARKTLQRCKPFLVVEVFDGGTEIAAELAGAGYREQDILVQPVMHRPDLVPWPCHGLWHCKPGRA